MLIKTLLLLITLQNTFNFIHGEDLPEYIHVCHKTDPDLEGCMKKSVNTLKPYLVSGISEIGIPKIEPINIGDLILADANPDFGLSIIAKDVKGYGSSNFNVTKIDVIEYGKKYGFQVQLPQLYVNGRYVVDGRILLLPIKGSGKFSANFTNCVADIRVIIEPMSETSRYAIKRFELKIRVGKGVLDLENLFNGNKELGYVINQTINNNFDIYNKEIMPLVERALTKYFTKVSNNIIGQFTKEQLFPV